MSEEKKAANTAPGSKIAMIMLGILVTPVLISSSSIGNRLTDGHLVLALIIGAIILALLAAINISIGEKARLPTYGVVKYPFGEKGAVVINVLLAVCLFGWIAVTANMFGYTLHDLLLQHGIGFPAPALVVIGCFIFVASTAFGLDVLGRFAQMAVPIVVGLLIYIVFFAFEAHTRTPVAHSLGEISHMSIGVATSTIVGTIIVLVATLPDFGSFSRNRKHAVAAAVAVFLIAYPLLYWAGAVPSTLSGQGSLTAAMALFGAALPAAVLLILACLSANPGNLFQGTLVVSTLFSRFPKWQITIALGIGAAIIGSINMMSWFIPFLLFLGIAVPPVAGIYIADFLIYRRKGYEGRVLKEESQVKILTFTAWLIGAFIGFLTLKGVFTLTGIPSLDSILVAAFGYWVFSFLQPVKKSTLRN